MWPRRRSVETVPAVTTNMSLELPRVGNVLVAGEHQVHPRAQQHLEQVAGVVDDVALAPGAGDRQQVMVEHEDAQVRRLGELLLDLRVAVAPDLAVVEVRLGRVHGHDRDAVLVERRARGPNSSSKWT